MHLLLIIISKYKFGSDLAIIWSDLTQLCHFSVCSDFPFSQRRLDKSGEISILLERFRCRSVLSLCLWSVITMGTSLHGRHIQTSSQRVESHSSFVYCERYRCPLMERGCIHSISQRDPGTCLKIQLKSHLIICAVKDLVNVQVYC